MPRHDLIGYMKIDFTFAAAAVSAILVSLFSLSLSFYSISRIFGIYIEVSSDTWVSLKKKAATLGEMNEGVSLAGPHGSTIWLVGPTSIWIVYLVL